MSVRNCKDVGQNLKKIISCLLENDRLVNLLYYTSKDPLSETPLTNEQKLKEVYMKLITMVPKVDTEVSTKTAKSVIAIRADSSTTIRQNKEFKVVEIIIDVFVPLAQWVIKDENLRPHAIMGEIEESIRGKTINGLGKIEGGDFDFIRASDETSWYAQTFEITSYD